MTNLSVNLNKIALLRNSRNIGIPSVTNAAKIAVEAGANGITVHPRPDERHIKPKDVYELAQMPDAFTSNSGWNLAENRHQLIPIIEKLKSFDIRISLFMDADSNQIPLAKEIGADRIELYTEPYATAFRMGEVEAVFHKYIQATKIAQDNGLGVNAGHDLNLQNLEKFCSIPNILEVSIGHALIAEALEMGLHNTVKAYLKILSSTS